MRILRLEDAAVGAHEGTDLWQAWSWIRTVILVPLLIVVVALCGRMSIMLFVKRVYMAIIIMAIVIFCVNLLRRKRFTKYKLEAMQREFEPSNNHPRVLVHIPLYNKKERVMAWKNVIYAFFFVRKIVAHFVTFFLYCIVVPAFVLVPEIHLPKFIAVYISSTITILNAMCTTRSFYLVIFCILFEDVMSMRHAKATIIGLLETSRANVCVVIEKLGNARRQRTIGLSLRELLRIGERVHIMEHLVALFLCYCGVFDVFHGRDRLFVYLLIQSILRHGTRLCWHICSILGSKHSSSWVSAMLDLMCQTREIRRGRGE